MTQTQKQLDQMTVELSQKRVDYLMNFIKFTCRKHYTRASEAQRFNRSWMNNLNDKVNSAIREILNYVDGTHSFHSVAQAAMKNKTLKAVR